MREGLVFRTPRELVVRAAALAAPVFVAADHRWTGVDDDGHFPTADEVAERLFGLVENIENHLHESSSTGGLTVWRSVVDGDVQWGVDLNLGSFYESDSAPPTPEATPINQTGGE